MRTPNDEQRLAIEHNGGVLLSAGAGSGKTFVLVEHVVFLIEKFHNENLNLLENDFKGRMRDFLSGIVLMTFTNKAAGEISIRLKQRLKNQRELKKESLLFSYWCWTEDVIDSMTVSTIHGLCYQLLKNGYFPKYENNLEVVSSVEISQRIEKLIEQWFEIYKNTNQYHVGDDPNIDAVVNHQKNLSASLRDIFLDPELRKMWRENSINDVLELDHKYLERIYRLLDIDYLFTDKLSLSGYDEFSSTKWYVFLDEFIKIKQSRRDFDLAYLELFKNFFIKWKGVRAPLKKLNLDPINEYMDDLKIFRDFIVKNFDDFESYFIHKEGFFKNWIETFLSIFKYIDERFDSFSGVTFSDLEFYVYESLKVKEYQDRVTSNYRYFIVDEFQDTSAIQFEILKMLCKEDFSKIFCVGDVKQAIYGFRGGSISVFEKCMRLVEVNYELSQNYRSHQNIIHFNNNLFESILPLGKNFKGQDQFSVNSSGQKYPQISTLMDCGEILKTKIPISVSLNSKNKKHKLYAPDLNYLEAKEVLNSIIKIKKENKDAEICLLYKNLGPSEFIISLLIEKDIGFTSQVKIPIGEDPIVSIFTLCLEFYLSRDFQDNELASKVKYISFLINGHLNILSPNVEVKENLLLESSLMQFLKDVGFIGVKESFYKLLFSLGLYNGDYINNSSLIESLVQMGRDSVELIYNSLMTYKSDKYSNQFIFGENSSNLKIMTTHASKGLEFEYVFLMGIHTNGRRMVDSSYFGKMPGSCRFRPNHNRYKSYKSPMYILENLISEHKDFSESKRLFYVACTRAIKGLYWSDISEEGSYLSSSKDSWINGIRYLEQNETQESLIASTLVEEESYDPENSLKNEKLPFFHKDPGGVLVTDPSLSLLTISELSVTRLAALSDCPKKFYFMNICKFEEEDIVMVKEVYTPKSSRKVIANDKSEQKSSSERGNLLHYEISKSIENQSYSFSNKNLSELDMTILLKVKDYLMNFMDEYDFYSEKQIKFSLFGSMISGIPDLVLRPKSSSQITKIIDYKTGIADSNIKSYWLQLACYAFSEFESSRLGEKKSVELVLYYIDQDIRYNKVMDFTQIKRFINSEMKALTSLDKSNLSHCSKCDFFTLCN